MYITKFLRNYILQKRTLKTRFLKLHTNYNKYNLCNFNRFINLHFADEMIKVVIKISSD